MKFAEKVYRLCKRIPKGKVSTYKELGKALGGKGQIYRAVGVALKNNRNKNVPCHRVVKSNGEVGGYNKGVKKKIEILRKEGVEVKGGKVDLKKWLFGL